MTAAAPVSTKPFPAELQPRRAELEKLSRSFADPAVWPEGEGVLRAHAPHDLGEVIVQTFHPALRHKHIAYLFVETMTEGGQRIKLGTAAKANAKLRLLAGIDFVLTFNHTARIDLGFEAKVALVDHELTHCDVDTDSGLPILIPHDIEEFGNIVRRYGLWKLDLVQFGRSMKDAMQGDLFNAAAEELESWKVAPVAESKPVRSPALDR